MPSSDLLKRLEALNGKPLQHVPDAEDGAEAAAPPQKRPAIARRPIQQSTGVLAELPPNSLHECLPGTVCALEGRGAYYCVSRAAVDHAPWIEDVTSRLGYVLEQPVVLRRAPRSITLEPAQALFVDLETLGLAGEPLFLIGALASTDDSMLCHQLLARNLDEEAAAIDAFASMARKARLLVTFNGTTFDLPLLRRRAEAHGVRLRLPRAHIDVLHEARGRYRRSLPNCKLQTLEEHVCGRKRMGDIPSAQIPGVYREFVRTGNAAYMAVVAHHNLLDLATTAELFVRFREE